MRIVFRSIVPCLIAVAGAAFATSSGLPIQRTGEVVDGGLTCIQCHNQFAPPVNQGNGRIQVSVNAYTPGVTQTLTVQVSDNAAIYWGFQLTARLASDETKPAGTFTPSDTVNVYCAPSGSAPCNGSVEFATQNVASTGGGVRQQRSYVVPWTPPGHDVGQVIFYAAGLAADGQGLGSGSRTYTTSTKTGSAGCNYPSRPSIEANGVTNGASFQAGISAGSLITIFGAPFSTDGPGYKVVAQDLVNGQLPLDLACVAVEIGGLRAPVFFTQLGQVNAQVPNLAAGATSAVVILNPGTANELRSDPAPVVIQSLAPALFTLGNTNSAAARDASIGYQPVADPAVAPGGVSANPGDIVTLYGTGFGPTNPFYPAGVFSTGPASLQQPVRVTIGGSTLASQDVLYAGLSPEAPGFYQFNVRIPASAPAGALPVSISIGANQTQFGVTIPVR